MRKQALIVTVLIGVLVSANFGRAQEELPLEPSFNCNKAQSPSEKTICADGHLLAGLDNKLAGLFNEVESKAIAGAMAAQRRWLKGRDKCRDDAECLFQRYTERLSQLARDLGDESMVSGAYSYELSPETNFGQLWFVRESDGSASGGFQTISGPTFHFCTLQFHGARAIGDAWLWSLPGSKDVPECTILFRVQPHGIRIDSVGCRQYCGARGWFDALYTR